MGNCIIVHHIHHLRRADADDRISLQPRHGLDHVAGGAAMFGALIAFAITIALSMRRYRRFIPCASCVCCIISVGALQGDTAALSSNLGSMERAAACATQWAREGLIEYLSHQVVRDDQLPHGSNKSRAG
jgi:hypothetical protein